MLDRRAKRAPPHVADREREYSLAHGADCQARRHARIVPPARIVRMSTTVAVPLWLAVLIAVLAGLALLDRLLVPSARWFLRSRANKVLDEVGSRLKIQIRPFQQSSRRALIDRLVYDDKVQQATRQFAATQRMPGEVAMHIARCAPRNASLPTTRTRSRTGCLRRPPQFALTPRICRSRRAPARNRRELRAGATKRRKGGMNCGWGRERDETAFAARAANPAVHRKPLAV
jgi:hypothetical protein